MCLLLGLTTVVPFMWASLCNGLEHVLLAAARLTDKCDHLLHFMHDILQWLPVSQYIEFKILIWV